MASLGGGYLLENLLCTMKDTRYFFPRPHRKCSGTGTDAADENPDEIMNVMLWQEDNAITTLQKKKKVY